MILEIKDLSENEAKEYLERAVEQISKLVEEKQRLEKAIEKACIENNIQYIRGLVK